MADIMKTMGLKAFGGAKRKPAESSTPTPAKKKPVEPSAPKGLFKGHDDLRSERSAETPVAGPSNEEVPKMKIPAIIADYTPEWPRHAKAIEGLVGEVKAIYRGQGHIRLQLNTVEEFRKVQRYLVTEELPFHTFTTRGMRPMKVVIRGLPGDLSADDIMLELADLGFEAEDCYRLKSLRGATNLWVVSLAPEDNVERRPAEILKLTRLYHLSIQVEIFKKRKGPAQCWRCQGFGHGSFNCHRPMKCVRCGGAHQLDRCPKPAGEVGICCNCGGAHNASYRGCSAFKKVKTSGRPAKRQAPERQPIVEADILSPDTDEEEGFTTVKPKKRKKRPPRNPENRHPAGPRPSRPAQSPPRQAREKTAAQERQQRPTPRRRIDWPPKTEPSSQPSKELQEESPADILKETLQQLTVLVKRIGDLIPCSRAVRDRSLRLSHPLKTRGQRGRTLSAAGSHCSLSCRSFHTRAGDITIPQSTERSGKRTDGQAGTTV